MMTTADAVLPQGSTPLGQALRLLVRSRGRAVRAWSHAGLWAGLVFAVALGACDRATTVTPPVAPRSGAVALGDPVGQRATGDAPLSVMIEPEHATTDTDLTAMANDAAVTYTWSVNGVPVDGVSGRELLKTQFRRSDTVAVQVTLNEQSARGETSIHNASPRTEGVSLDRPLGMIHQGLDLTAIPKGIDPDGDEIRWEYQWIRNNEEIPGETSVVLRGDRYRRGDRVTVTVTPADAFTRGEPYTPLPVTIPNGPPAFVSRPPGLKASPEYVYQVQAVDPDGDPVHFRLVNAPGGMTVDGETGMLRWPLKGTPPGRHAVEIAVDDGQGATASQPFELEIAPPEGS